MRVEKQKALYKSPDAHFWCEKWGGFWKRDWRKSWPGVEIKFFYFFGILSLTMAGFGRAFGSYCVCRISYVVRGGRWSAFGKLAKKVFYWSRIGKKCTKDVKNDQKSAYKVLYKHISSAALQVAEIPYRQVNMTKGASFASWLFVTGN